MLGLTARRPGVLQSQTEGDRVAAWLGTPASLFFLLKLAQRVGGGETSLGGGVHLPLAAGMTLSEAARHLSPLREVKQVQGFSVLSTPKVWVGRWTDG